jgi:predicted outer membrane repeat protein
VGGAVYLLNSTAAFTDVLFSGNEAAWVGGALYAFGTWGAVPRTTARLERTSFFANHARPAPGQSAVSATQGGAIHAEDQVTVTILDSAFAANSAAVGAAVNLYRSTLDATGSIFRDHRAPDGFGGTIAALSADQSDASTGKGAINRPNARVVLRDSLLQGPLDPGLAGALSGGCLLAGGDGGRVTGAAGVPAQGGLGANRAEVVLEGVVFSGCSTTARGNTAASGGALRADLVDLEMRDGLVLGSSARGKNGAGGGLSLVGASLATLSGVTFAGNSADSSGGAVQVRGATLDADGGRFLGNSAGLGAAIYSIPSNTDPVAGTVQRNLFAGQAGVPLRDVGPPSLPANCLRYDANRFLAGASEDVYVHNTAAPAGLNVPGLNNLVVGSCDKSTAPNTRETQPPREGVLAAIQAAGSPGQRLGPYLAFAWTGTAATLDGAPLAPRFGLVGTVPGAHKLDVAGGQSVTVVVDP